MAKHNNLAMILRASPKSRHVNRISSSLLAQLNIVVEECIWNYIAPTQEYTRDHKSIFWGESIRLVVAFEHFLMHSWIQDLVLLLTGLLLPLISSWV